MQYCAAPRLLALEEPEAGQLLEAVFTEEGITVEARSDALRGDASFITDGHVADRIVVVEEQNAAAATRLPKK